MPGCCNLFLNANDLIQADVSHARKRYLQRYRLDDVVPQKGSNSKLEKLEKRVFKWEPNPVSRRQSAVCVKIWASVPVCLSPSRLVGGRTATCVCATIPGLVTALSWSLWMTRSTSEWSLWKRGPLSSWNPPTRARAHVFGTLCRAACPWTRGNAPRSQDTKGGGCNFCIIAFSSVKITWHKKMAPDLKMSKSKYYLLQLMLKKAGSSILETVYSYNCCHSLIDTVG